MCITRSLRIELAYYDLIDRDSARWKMDPKIVQRRRSLFWEMLSMDFFYVSGREILYRPTLILSSLWCWDDLQVYAFPMLIVNYLKTKKLRLI